MAGIPDEIVLTPEQLRATQLVELDMMLEVDRICREHGLRYSLAGGTLLGAARHKGFIPWDDDVDLLLLREEYDKFVKIFPQATQTEKYYFQDIDNTKGYRWGYGKIRRKNSLWMRHGQEHLPFGQEISIDIFPLDKLPSGKIRGNLHDIHCFIIRKLLWSEVGKYTENSALLRFWYTLISKIPLKAVLSHYKRFMNKHNTPKNKFLRALTVPTPRGYPHEGHADWYDSYIELEFEGHMFKAMRGYENYLRLKYGDYMKLPPEGERETHPVSGFKLPEE